MLNNRTSVNKIKRIGLTGGIGSGKSTVAKLFELLQIPVYYADERAKYLMHHHSEVRKAIIALFGEAAYDEQQQLNRSYIASKAFTDKSLLTKLNEIVHPAVFADLEAWYFKQNSPYVIKEAALIFETIMHQQLDKIIVVTAPEELRIQRLQKRDQSSIEQIKQRMANQLPEAEKLAKADFVVYNDETQFLITQVLAIDEVLRKE